MMSLIHRCLFSVMLGLLLSNKSLALGVSAYLPLYTSPEIERQIERALILAGIPVVRKPIPVALVKGALPRVCLVDRSLCEQVGNYLNQFEQDAGLTQASLDLALIGPN